MYNYLSLCAENPNFNFNFHQTMNLAKRTMFCFHRSIRLGEMYCV